MPRRKPLKEYHPTPPPADPQPPNDEGPPLFPWEEDPQRIKELQDAWNKRAPQSKLLHVPSDARTLHDLYQALDLARAIAWGRLQRGAFASEEQAQGVAKLCAMMSTARNLAASHMGQLRLPEGK